MNQRNWYFGEVLDEANLDAAFANVEAAINNHRKDVREPGVVWGCRISPNGADVNSFLISTGVIQGPNGERIFIRENPNNVGGYYDVDTAGISTDPGTGNHRWVTVCARFGRQMSGPVTDDLSSTVYTGLADSWNANGLAYATDATKAANDAHDGGAQLDASGHTFDGFYIVAGPTTGTGSTPTYPSLPADAVILGDILYTDGDQGAVLLDGAISVARRQTAFVSDGGKALADSSLQFERKLLFAGTNYNYNTWVYLTSDGLEICSNAQWDAVTQTWSVQTFTPSPACRLRISPYGINLDQLVAAEITGPWNDTVGAAGGWTNTLRIGNFTSSGLHIGTLDVNGNATGNGTQTGYVSWGGVVTGSPSNPIGYAGIQFPRAFTTTPSSVTLGLAGPNETNVSTVGTGNFRVGGCDFLVSATTNAKTVAQRPYTALQ